MSDISDTLVMIPARMQASRLPGKPMAMIGDDPMIVHVWRRACAANVGRVVVASDSDEILDAIKAAGGEGVLTRSDHQSGSDRIAEAVSLIDPDGAASFVVNLQGDLPTLEAGLVAACVGPLKSGSVEGNAPGADITTLASPITKIEERDNANVVKVVGTPVAERAGAGEALRLRALYFTRASAPYGEGPLYHHIGIYGYTREALERFVALSPSMLERRERLEQLRALEAGMRIEVTIVDAIPLGVDTQADLDRARKVLGG